MNATVTSSREASGNGSTPLPAGPVKHGHAHSARTSSSVWPTCRQSCCALRSASQTSDLDARHLARRARIYSGIKTRILPLVVTSLGAERTNTIFRWCILSHNILCSHVFVSRARSIQPEHLQRVNRPVSRCRARLKDPIGVRAGLARARPGCFGQ